MCPKPDMNSFTYMRSEADCIWQILCEQTTLRDRRFIGSQAAHGVILIFQDLEASTQSASIRTGVNEMMSRFVALLGYQFHSRGPSTPPALRSHASQRYGFLSWHGPSCIHHLPHSGHVWSCQSRNTTPRPRASYSSRHRAQRPWMTPSPASLRCSRSELEISSAN